MAKINFKIVGDWQSVLFTASMVFIFASASLWFASRPQVFADPTAGISQRIVRDEFIDKLVEETTDVYTLVKVGRQYYQSGELERAQKLFKKAAQLDRNYRDAFYHLGLAEFELGNTDRAFYAFLRAKTIDSIYKPSYEMLAQVYEKRGEAAKAEQTRQLAEKLL